MEFIKYCPDLHPLTKERKKPPTRVARQEEDSLRKATYEF